MVFDSAPSEMTAFLVVKQVLCKPVYNLHVTMTGNTPSPMARLDFRCTVTQWTGENWDNISLALTTGDQVSQLIQLPEPKRINISLSPTHIVQHPAIQLQQPRPSHTSDFKLFTAEPHTY